jgi:very-short-patch-repair endonuclease/Zn ribbon nucleic-acid-binding protein
MKKLTNDEFISKSNNKHNYTYTYLNSIYKNNKEKIIITCRDHGDFKQRPGDHINGQGCPDCKKIKIGNLWRNNISDILNNCRIKHNNLYNYSPIINYKNTDTKIEIICKIHGSFYQSSHNHLKGQGCPKCKFEKLSLSKRHTKDYFIELCEEKFKNKNYDYSLVVYKNDKTKVEIICPVHGLFKQTPNYFLLYGKGCPKCIVSNGENKIINFLIENNIQFKHQKIFDDCKYIKKLRFDFFIKEKNTVIEFDGQQHFSPIEIFGGDEQYRKNIIKDNIKNKYCEEKNIKLIRIPFTEIENIKEILKLKLINE